MVRSEKKKKQNNNGNVTVLGVGMKKGPWTPEEDRKLLSYIQQFGHGSWRSLPAKAGLKRCGKSCRLRWTNYLRPDIKRGKFSMEEERTIIQLHALLGNREIRRCLFKFGDVTSELCLSLLVKQANSTLTSYPSSIVTTSKIKRHCQIFLEFANRWSTIAAHLPRRTDNEIKNHWNSHIKKRMTKMGIDPMTHKPKNGTQLLSSNLNHMAQWEAARLEAEARLVQKPKNHLTQPPTLVNSPTTYDQQKTPSKVPPPYLPCLDVLKVWQGNLWSNYSINNDTLQSLISTSNASVATPSMPVLNHIYVNGSCDHQGPNITTKHEDQTETKILLDPFEDFSYVDDHDSNFVNIGDPLRSPDFWEEFVDLVDGGWKNITNNFAMITSPPASPVC